MFSFSFMYDQFTRRADKDNPTSVAVVSQFTAGENLNTPWTSSVDPRKSECSKHELVVNPTVNHATEIAS